MPRGLALVVPVGGLALVVAALIADRVSDLRQPPPPPALATPRPADPPPPARPAEPRDPFVTGAEWRRERRAAPPSPGSPAPSPSPRARPGVPPPVLLGTLTKDGRRLAVTADTIAGPGARLGAWRVLEVGADHAVVELDGRTVRLSVDLRPDR